MKTSILFVPVLFLVLFLGVVLMCCIPYSNADGLLGSTQNLNHPADVNVDFRLTISEAIAYLSGWQTGSNPMDYAILAAALWQQGEQYFYDYDTQPPLCWAPPGRRMKGMSMATWTAGACQEGESDQAVAELVSLGVSDIAVVPTWYQASLHSTDIYPTPGLTMTDEDVRHLITHAHNLGFQVMLKPHLDPVEGGWRGDICSFNEEDWQDWMNSYRNMINHYADLAAELNVALFCIGTELKKTSERTADWLSIIEGVSKRFFGEITYGANWDEYTAISFWNALNYIGIDAYFPLTENNYCPTVDQLKAGWTEPLHALHDFSMQYGLPVLFTEIGYCSYDGTNTKPYTWETTTVVDLQEQADCYRAAYEVLWNAPWFAGFYWWNWDPNISHGGPYDPHYSPRNKPASEIIRSYYAR